MKIRVRKSDGKTHAMWASHLEAQQLLRAGLAQTYGSRRKVHGLTLKCDLDRAGVFLFGAGTATSRRGVYREHVAQRFYIYQHNNSALAPAARHIALATEA